ncbi:MAG TPA: hypothetical protein VM308_02325 [Sphingomicrobium sp.]|nr:hypothetical protein [Sphingomicrobium sp.]
MRIRGGVAVLLSALALAGCRPPPPSPAFLAACGAGRTVERNETRPSDTLFFPGTRIGFNFFTVPLELPTQPCLTCIYALAKGYSAIEYPLLPIEGGAGGEARVARHAFAVQGDPRYAWIASAPGYYRRWIASKTPPGRCVTLETGPRTAVVAVERIEKRHPGGFREQTFRAVDSRTGSVIARSTTFIQDNGELRAHYCRPDRSDPDARQLNEVLQAVPPLGRVGTR